MVDVGLLLAVAGAAAAYAAGVRRLQVRGRRWPAGRSAAFAAGLVAVALAGAGAAGDESSSFTAHALQHALLAMVAPLLLALGGPVTLALQATARPTQVGLLRLVHARPVAVLTSPVVAWVLFGGSTLVLYTTPLLEASLRSGLLHAAMHLHLLLVGCLFCWTVVGVDPLPRRLPPGARLAAVGLALPFHAVVGLALVSSGSLLAPDFYGDLGAQHAGGAVLWATGELFGLAAAGIVLAQWMAADDRESARLDRRLAG
ncbi:MAG TPA: cytochrome c oxidase assembly protein [Acidimicrobiales bacterium]|jgi:putative copper resistance protein D|nr:cytochrome c oxidase assembly protein [Acidimicrobiales bacterium]